MPTTTDWDRVADKMALRDWFAGIAPPMPEQWYEDSRKDNPELHWAHIDAAWRYFWAAAMLAARDRGLNDCRKATGGDR